MDPAPPRVPQTAAVIRTGTPPNWLRNSIAINRDSSSRRGVRADAICLCGEVAGRRRYTYIAAARRWDMRQIHWLFPRGLAECVEADAAERTGDRRCDVGAAAGRKRCGSRGEAGDGRRPQRSAADFDVTDWESSRPPADQPADAAQAFSEFLIDWTSVRTVWANVFSSCIARRTRVPAALLPSL